MLTYSNELVGKPIAEVVAENLSGTEWVREALYAHDGRFYLLKDVSDDGMQIFTKTVSEAVLWAVDSFDDAELEDILEKIIKAAK